MSEKRSGKDRRVKQIQIFGKDRRKSSRRYIDEPYELKLDREDL